MTNSFDDEEDIEERFRNAYGLSYHYWAMRKQKTNAVKKKMVTKKRKVVKKNR
jgi:hypothetical protein